MAAFVMMGAILVCYAEFSGAEREGLPLGSKVSLLAAFLFVVYVFTQVPGGAGDDDPETPAYRKMVAAGKGLSTEKQELYAKMAWWSSAKTKSGTRVFILAPRGPGGDIDYYVHMWELLAFAVSLMHDKVVKENERYAVIWAQCSDHRIWPWTARRFQLALHPKLVANLECLHVVHPSWTIRALRLALWPIARDEFWDQFECHERIEFLDTHIDMHSLKLPQDLYKYDKFLDEQAAQMSEQASKQMSGGMGSNMIGKAFGYNDEAMRQEHTDQLEKFRRLLEEKQQNPDSRGKGTAGAKKD